MQEKSIAKAYDIIKKDLLKQYKPYTVFYRFGDIYEL